MFKLLGSITYSFRWFWIAVGIIVLSIGIVYGVSVFPNLKSGGLTDPASGSAREASALVDDFPRSRISIILLASSNNLTVDQPVFKSSFEQVLSDVEEDPSRPYIQSYYDNQSSALVSKDRHETFALIGVPGDEDAAYLRIRQLIKPTALKIALGGPAVSDYEINAEVQKDLPKLGAISLPLLGILLIFIFRSVIAAALPLLIGAVSVLGAFAITRVLTHFLDMSVFAANIISLLGLGLAIDYSLLYVSRFRDELASGKTVEEAIAICTTTAGEAIFLSGSTVAFSLLGLLAFPEMFLRSMGIGGATAVVVAMASSLTILPAILSILGHGVDFLTIPLPALRVERQERAWRRLGSFVVRWAAPVLVVTLAALIAAGQPFLHVRFANPGSDSLPKFFQSRQVADTISKKFPASQNPPIEVLLTLPASPVETNQIIYLQDYVNRVQKLSHVTNVDSIVTAGIPGSPSDISSLLSMPQVDPRLTELTQHYVSGNTTLIDVNYRGDSESQATQQLVRLIRSIPLPGGSKAIVGGDTAELVDRLDSLAHHLPTAVAVIFAATFVVLLLMLSSLLIPVKAIVLNTLSLSAAFGLMTWIFQEGHLHSLLQFTSSGSLDPTLPVLIFAIAFGLATDYEVFLVSRIKEEFYRTGSNSEAVVIGVEKTGGIITSAGLLLVVVVAAFGLSDILSMKEMGVGLAIAVLVDAAVVRTLLVPAAMQLFGNLNWWLPGKSMPKSKVLETASHK